MRNETLLHFNPDVQKSSIIARATIVCSTLQSAGFLAYFVGGCVRDLILFPDEAPKDIDICTSASPQQIEAIFGVSPFVGKSFGVCLVRINEFVFEVASFRKEGRYSDRRHPDTVELGTIEEDAGRRDFTVNALYLDPVSLIVLDFFGGRTDLDQKLMRCAGDARCRLFEDPLRILRLFRFASRFEFEIVEDTLRAAKDEQSGIGLLSRDRILSELAKVSAAKVSDFYEAFFANIHWKWIFLEFAKIENTLQIKPAAGFKNYFTGFSELNALNPFYGLMTFVFGGGEKATLKNLQFLTQGYNLNLRESKLINFFQVNSGFKLKVDSSDKIAIISRCHLLLKLVKILGAFEPSYSFVFSQSQVHPKLNLFLCLEWSCVLKVYQKSTNILESVVEQQPEISKRLPSKDVLLERVKALQKPLWCIGRSHQIREMAPVLLAIDAAQKTTHFSALLIEDQECVNFYLNLAVEWEAFEAGGV